ncbi:D-alanyl-D-alanine carboxypeptidase [Pseudidiomarina piscicola]|uniref:D-alanyl-D-alanine carboxypeptidase n=1 Tax=Pseudidiomarina piscicola TaxID=2614830 RepID=A0A6S6WVA1_9GAMM|nr:serine hydrolase domain-containing protein [Pseudidiomarina piscicola]CAB0151370.1 D-alanyl-D-alanine carboxypeptidase [Pseudidiomarina piscicola]VZT40851.1 D-alanyl-D-alanine carboxypeptidase [Pseudomonas aeruginosa]
MKKTNRVTRRLRIIMPIVALIVTLAIAPIDLLPYWLAPVPDTVQEQVDEAVEQGLDGIIVAIDKAGQAPEFYAAGWKNKALQQPADPQALFKIASISKLYIATAVAKLAHGGVISLDQSLADYLPELADRIEHADAISLRMMVQHRSGIPNFTDTEGWDWFTPKASSVEALRLVLDLPADFEPDARNSYSNTNYLLIGRILDKVLGYRHQHYIQQQILLPLGLTDTYSLFGQVDSEQVVSGYWYHYEDDLKSLDHVIPGGSMIATIEDVGRFVRALNDGSLLNDQEQAIYTSLYPYHHKGWLPGYHSIAKYYEASDTVIVQFVNTTGGDTWGVASVVGGKATAISSIVYDRIAAIVANRPESSIRGE